MNTDTVDNGYAFSSDHNNNRAMYAKTEIKEIIYLVLIYFFAHFLLLIISGQWWDDWTVRTMDFAELKQHFAAHGAPWGAYVNAALMWIPNGGYRTVVFFVYLCIGLMFYYILVNLDFIHREDAFWMSAIAITVPINDARTTLICAGYAISLMLFFLSFVVLILSKDIQQRIKKTAFRFFSLLCLFCSYIMESLLVFTLLIWAYLFYCVCREYTELNSVERIKKFLFSYWDFLILPFVFFAVKELIFSPVGRYVSYNDVTIKSVLKGVVFSPICAITTVANVVIAYRNQVKLWSCVFIIMIVLFFIIKCRNKEYSSIEKNSFRHYVINLIIGIIVYYAGLFAYAVVRGGGKQGLAITGVQGRDSILIGFGIGIMIIAIVRMTPIKIPLQNTILVFLILLGVLHFNEWYLNYQEDWYYQKQVESYFENNDDFGNDNTILCDFSTLSPIDGTRFYTINALSKTTTGKEDIFYYSGIKDLKYKEEFDPYFLFAYNCNKYDPADMSIDGVLIINNVTLNNDEVLRIKYDELFRSSMFDDDIQNRTDIQYLRVDKETSDRIFDLYYKNELSQDVLHGMLISN